MSGRGNLEPNKPNGFTWIVRVNGEVEVLHHGRVATVLRGETATKVLASLTTSGADQQQEILARVTGNYRRGNERQARNHPRNR